MVLARIPVPDYVAFDLETSGLDPANDEILEIALARFSGGQVVERWSTLVRPTKPVPLKTLRLTHIAKADLESAPEITEVIHMIDEFRGSLPLVGHNPAFDVSFLQRYLPGFPGVDLYDTLELGRILVPGLKSYRLSELALFLGVKLEDAHRAYDDALASGHIFREIQDRILYLPPYQARRIMMVMGQDWRPGRTLFQGLSNALLPESSCLTRPASQEVSEDYQDVCSVLVEALRGASQGQSMVRLSSSETLLDVCRELVKRDGERILILGHASSCEMGEGVAYIGLPREFLCIAKLEKVVGQTELLIDDDLSTERRQFLASLVVWASATRTGCRKEIQIPQDGYGVWNELSCPDSMDCSGNCPVAEECFFLRARRRAEKSSVVWSGDESLASQLGAFSRAVIWDYPALRKSAYFREPRVDLLKLKESLSTAGFVKCLDLVDSSIETAKSQGEGLIGEELKSVLVELSLGLEEEIREVSARGPRNLGKAALALSLVRSSSANLARIVEDNGSALGLVESSYSDEGHKTPVVVKRHIWPLDSMVTGLNCQNRIYVSGMSEFVGKKPGLRRLFSIDRDAPVLSPAGCSDSLLLTVSVDKYPLPRENEYPSYVGEFLKDLAMRRPKRCLCLFPNYQLLKSVYALTEPVLAEMGIAVFGQGLDGGAKVLEHLGEEDVMVFARSGTDLPEGTLPPTMLVVTKVPFSKPSPVDEARRKELSGIKLDPFVEIDVSLAAMEVMMYVEPALARGERACVVILDPRCLPNRSKWGKDFMECFSTGERRVLRPGDAAAHAVHYCFGR